MTGAAVGDTVVAAPTPIANGIETKLLTWIAYVSAPGTVTVRVCSFSGTQDAVAQTWRVDVWKH